jgi:tetrapyrrole methylase family protein/MazG family protein
LRVAAEPEKFATLVAVIARLRGPEGCPWDKEQTHASLRGNLLQECYEVLEALDKTDAASLCEELGDLLMQVVLHAQIARESEEFSLEDVIRGITTKLISRHPHVFGKRRVKDTDEVLRNWETLKQEERPAGSSILTGVPSGMPALAYSQEIQRRVARLGFDWENIDGVFDKLAEEVAEVREAKDKARRAEEFGDVVFTLANIARHLDIDLEATLREANSRFQRRFTRMEKTCRERGVNLGELSLAEQNAHWEESKREE